MPFERWGSLSVDDHVDARALLTNVLLYDRLVVPEWTHQADRDERAYWIGKGWDPDLQAERLDQLGDLAIRRPWNKARRSQFRTRFAEVAAEQQDARWDGEHVTRMILAQEQVLDRPPGVHGVTVVPAYNSTTAFQNDFPILPATDQLGVQACLLSRRMALPDVPDEEALNVAISLSRDSDFRAKRNDLFDWQALALKRNWTPDEAVERIVDLVDRYNAKVKEAVTSVRWKFAFTIFASGLGFVTGGPVGAGAAAALSLVQFAKIDSKPTVDAGGAQPVAMFHDVETRLGIKLT